MHRDIKYTLANYSTNIINRRLHREYIAVCPGIVSYRNKRYYNRDKYLYSIEWEWAMQIHRNKGIFAIFKKPKKVAVPRFITVYRGVTFWRRFMIKNKCVCTIQYKSGVAYGYDITKGEIAIDYNRDNIRVKIRYKPDEYLKTEINNNITIHKNIGELDCMTKIVELLYACNIIDIA